MGGGELLNKWEGFDPLANYDKIQEKNTLKNQTTQKLNFGRIVNNINTTRARKCEYIQKRVKRESTLFQNLFDFKTEFLAALRISKFKCTTVGYCIYYEN